MCLWCNLEICVCDFERLATKIAFALHPGLTDSCLFIWGKPLYLPLPLTPFMLTTVYFDVMKSSLLAHITGHGSPSKGLTGMWRFVKVFLVLVVMKCSKNNSGILFKSILIHFLGFWLSGLSISEATFGFSSFISSFG